MIDDSLYKNQANRSLDFPSDNNSFSGSVPPEILALDLISLSVYGNKLSNLVPIDGSVVCTAPGPDLGDHYCDCKNHCVGDVYEPDRCACEDAQACCTEFLGQYEPCVICDGPFAEPDKFVPELLATCFHFSRFVLKGIEQFGDPSSCREISRFGEEAGCRCAGTLPYEECHICEYGVANPDFFIQSVGATCKEAHEVVKQDVAAYGLIEQCNEARVAADAFGCKCKSGSSDLKDESDLEDEPESVTECVVCPFGVQNPSFFMSEFQATCEEGHEYTRLNVDPLFCDEARASAEAAGCKCLPDPSGTECIVCPFGVQNPSFFVSEFQATCEEGHEYTRLNVDPLFCDQARASAEAAGCKCLPDPSDLEGGTEAPLDLENKTEAPLDLENKTEVPLGLEEYTPCVVCPNGELDDPLFFVEGQQLSCLDLTTLVEEDISTYGTISACAQTRSELSEAGCRCKINETDLKSTLDSF